MREIIKHYGQAVLVVIAFAALMAILFVNWPGTGSLLSYIGNYISTSQDTQKDFDADADKIELNTYSQRRYPTAETKTRVKELQPMQLMNCFDIKDCDNYSFYAPSFNPGISVNDDGTIVNYKANGEFVDNSSHITDRRAGNVYVKSLYAFTDDGTRIDYIDAIYVINGNYNININQIDAILHPSAADAANPNSPVYTSTLGILLPGDPNYPADAMSSSKSKYNKYMHVYNRFTGEVMFPDANTYYTDLSILDYYEVETNCTCYVAVDVVEDAPPHTNTH